MDSAGNAADKLHAILFRAFFCILFVLFKHSLAKLFVHVTTTTCVLATKPNSVAADDLERVRGIVLCAVPSVKEGAPANR